MGKADNIRRAKKLKEAKRKREMDALPFVDLGPAAKAMVKRKTREGATMRQNNGEILYSNLLYQYLTPILSDDDEFELFKVKIVFGIFTWNAAILREKNEEAYITAKGDVLKIFSYQPDAEKL